MQIRQQLNILGIRGIPAAHGGFETFAERLAVFLVSRGVAVTVYCQSDKGQNLEPRQDSWKGVHRVHIGTKHSGCLGTMEFDLKCARHVVQQPGVDLVLGYNTAVFNLLQRFHKRQVFMNMDGIEWKRAKWSMPAKMWFILNEIIGANLATTPIADHPEIAKHVAKRCRTAPVIIPYGGDIIGAASDEPLRNIGTKAGKYFLSIARIEPENSILEIVQAHMETSQDMDLVVLGRLDPRNAYHRKVRATSDGKVIFPGAIYDDDIVKSLRFHARAYMHGHQVGGTNPSLVEALGAGNAVIAHDNKFNRWTAGKGQRYFKSVEDCANHMNAIARDDIATYSSRMAARERHSDAFRWGDVLSQYETLLFDAALIQMAAE